MSGGRRGSQGSGGAGGGGAGSGSNGGTGTQSVRVNNTEFNSMFQPYHDMRMVTCRMIKTRIANGEIPPLPASKVYVNVQMCLPWHTRAQVYDQLQLSSQPRIIHVRGICSIAHLVHGALP